MNIMFKPLYILLILLMFGTVANAQKWQRGRIYDIKGNTQIGLIHLNPSGKQLIDGEAFVEFKAGEKASPVKISAGELKSVVVGRDSFIVARAPVNVIWSKYETDFVYVALDEDIKLYALNIGGHGAGFSPEFGIGFGMGFGTGGYGSGFGLGTGISIPIGGGGGGGRSAIQYYYGESPANMKPLTNENFQDIMTDIMGDEPDVVNKIAQRAYGLNNIENLIEYFEKVQASHAR
jgi:hypothetical protein